MNEKRYLKLLQNIKKQFTQIESCYRQEQFSDGNCIINETIIFLLPFTNEKEVKNICNILEIIYILASIKYESNFIKLYSKILPYKEGDRALYLLPHFVETMLIDFENELFIEEEEILDKIKEIKDDYLFSKQKLIMLNRVEWQINQNLIKRRLAIGAIDLKARRYELKLYRRNKCPGIHNLLKNTKKE